MRDVIERIPDEANDAYSDDDLFSISSWGADLSFRELIARYDNEELVKPELQRKYVWDRVEASRFIDSILLGLPVPSIFLAKTREEKMLIVDGYQRIMTVRDFVRGIFTSDGRVFKLSSSKVVNPRWQGKAFTELTDAEQRKIRNTTIHAIIFLQQQPQGSNTSLHQVFERINTSGRTLMAQEIRNCVSQGKFNTLLFELNKNPKWRALFGLEPEEPRMRDMEFILRFFALSSEKFQNETKERISLKQFLDLYMEQNRDPNDDDLRRMKERFQAVMDLVFDTFGTGAFQNLSATHPDKLANKFSPTIFDSITIAADAAITSGRYVLPTAPEDERRALLRDPQYKAAISKETMRTETIRLRIRLANEKLFRAV